MAYRPFRRPVDRVNRLSRFRRPRIDARRQQSLRVYYQLLDAGISRYRRYFEEVGFGVESDSLAPMLSRSVLHSFDFLTIVSSHRSAGYSRYFDSSDSGKSCQRLKFCFNCRRTHIILTFHSLSTSPNII